MHCLSGSSRGGLNFTRIRHLNGDRNSMHFFLFRWEMWIIIIIGWNSIYTLAFLPEINKKERAIFFHRQITGIAKTKTKNEPGGASIAIFRWHNTFINVSPYSFRCFFSPSSANDTAKRAREGGKEDREKQNFDRSSEPPIANKSFAIVIYPSNRDCMCNWSSLALLFDVWYDHRNVRRMKQWHIEW